MALSKGTRVRVNGRRPDSEGKVGTVANQCESCRAEDGTEAYYIQLDGEKGGPFHYQRQTLEVVVNDDTEMDTFLALAGLEQRLRDAETAISDITRLFETTRATVKETRQQLDAVKASLGDKLPPFQVGQRVRSRRNRGAGHVQALDRAFGKWMVLVRYPNSETDYTYPASELEAA